MYAFQTSLPDGIYCDLANGGYVNGRCTGNKITVSRGHVEVGKASWEEDGYIAIHVEVTICYTVNDIVWGGVGVKQ